MAKATQDDQPAMDSAHEGVAEAEPTSVLQRFRARVKALLDLKVTQSLVVAIILLNGAIIGLETSPEVMSVVGHELELANMIIVGFFVVEVGLRIFAEGWRFFRSGWNVFDFIVVALALIPASTGSEVLRVLRILRVLRLLSVVRSMRLVVDSLAAAIPGFASIAGLLLLVLYVFSVISTMLFREASPEGFGSLGMAFVQHFRLMLGDGWPDVVGPVAAELGGGVWVYFIVYTVISSLIVLNLLIAVVVEAMDRKSGDIDEEDAQASRSASVAGTGHDDALREELAALRREIRSLRAELRRP